MSEEKVASDWFKSLYNVSEISDDELREWYNVYQYQGFNRTEVLAELKHKVDDVKICQQIIVVCALRGPQRAAATKLMNGRLISSYGIPASGMKGSKGISCQRVTAATADLAAYFLKRLNAPKRLNLECPGWLQFPSAGSIILPEPYRTLHLEFANKFSPVIGGVFNEQIYMQMVANAYLDPSLNLFNEPTGSSTKVGVKPIKV